MNITKYISVAIPLIIFFGLILLMFQKKLGIKLNNKYLKSIFTSTLDGRSNNAIIGANNHSINESMIPTTSLNFYEDVLKD